KDNAPWKLPVDAKQLPATASIIEAEAIEGASETDPRVKQAYTAAELGSEICREGTADPAHQLELMGILGSSSARQFFKPANLTQVQEALECGGLLATNLDGNFQTAIGFVDDSGAKAEVDILTLKVQDLPTKYGLTKHAFGGVDGYCRTSDPSKPGVTLDCGAIYEEAVH